MITADPNQLRYGAHRFAAAAQELQQQSLQLEQTTTSVRQGSDGWSGEGSQSFLLRGERLAADVKKASSAFESVAHTLSRFAMRMEQVLELRRRADRLDQQAFEYGDDSLDSIHTRQHLRHQAAQLRHQANAEASNADSQASSEFQMIAKMIPPTLVPGADAVSPLLEGLPKHWQEYYSRHPELLEEEIGAPTLTADQIEANRRSDAMTILIEYHKQSQSLWLSDEDRTEAARVFCEQSYSKLTADDLENEINRISAEEERNKHWQDQIQNGAHGKELIQQEGYTEYALKQYYQDGAVLGMAAAITAVGGRIRKSKQQKGNVVHTPFPDGDGQSFSKSSAENIRRHVSHDILDEMEAQGGHLLEKHVGKTNEDLLRRAAQEGVPSTTFSDKNTAIKAVQENIRKNADQISNWLGDPTSRGYLITKVEHQYPIGNGVDVKNGGNSASKQVTNDLSASQLYLVKDPLMPTGYRIITGYPVFK